MRLQITTRNDVRRLTLAAVLAVLTGSLALQRLMLPPALADQAGIVIPAVAMMLAAPLALFLAGRLRAAQNRARSLERALHRDPLTGVATRTGLFRAVAALGPEPAVVIIADIDHFKTVNDRHGHLAGDAALCDVAGRLRSNCRAGDIVARFGGEEFVLVLRDLSLAQGVAVAERLRAQIRTRPVTAGGRVLPLTASFGVAATAAATPAEAAIHSADMALYRAKAGGRDRVCAAPGPPPDPLPTANAAANAQAGCGATDPATAPAGCDNIL